MSNYQKTYISVGAAAIFIMLVITIVGTTIFIKDCIKCKCKKCKNKKGDK